MSIVLAARALAADDRPPRVTDRNAGTWRVRWARVGFEAPLERRFSSQLEATTWFMAELRSSSAPLALMVLEQREGPRWELRSSVKVDQRVRHRYAESRQHRSPTP